MDDIQTTMHEHLRTAMTAFQHMAKKDREEAEKHIQDIIAIKYDLEKIAMAKGFSQACKESIPVCRGVCCKWHFPRHLTPADFFVAIFGVPREKQKELSALILGNSKHQCPMLLSTGCFLPFEQRPVACTDAYPCFHNQSYWEEKERRSSLRKKAFTALSDMIVKAL